ncbi:uncharacterized protein LOC111277646 [Durio zibethinus]|uniref:Uncharacterized protein LOC111277646 n=1 Tax=Durio zibethinus TaxID=66656 RepID=A0A6P5WUJ5_DURZI|nr:uncharacterized protein LOC111277646 [Durio zibethinus]
MEEENTTRFERVERTGDEVNVEEPLYPPGFTPPQVQVQVPRGIHIQPPSAQPYSYVNHFTNQQSTHLNANLGPIPVDPIMVPNLDDPVEQEKSHEISEPVINSKIQDKYDQLEERLKAVEGNDTYGVIDANELSLVPDLVISPKFKTPDFKKYDGIKCPSAHITMFCRKMTGHIHNDKLLIHYFQDSLTGSVAKWYVQLDRNKINSWKNLAKVFLA